MKFFVSYESVMPVFSPFIGVKNLYLTLCNINPQHESLEGYRDIERVLEQ